VHRIDGNSAHKLSNSDHRSGMLSMDLGKPWVKVLSSAGLNRLLWKTFDYHNLKMAVKMIWQCMFSPRLYKIYDDRRLDVSFFNQ
jgi:hypothetical protein